jgi:hypothetical protein
MHTHVIVLAQGRQERMGDSTGGLPKQLLPLPACGGQPILLRTIHQLGRLLHRDDTRITLVSWHEVISRVLPAQAPIEPEGVSLLDPGNSSLKGIQRYLDQLALIAGAPRADRTVVLLGDVVYSWMCLEAILADVSNPNGAPIAFCGTKNISPSGGELWGIAWGRDADFVMEGALAIALEKHPPFHDTYQPGQLRRWMWSIHPSFQTTSRYRPIDDYTMDVDLPAHVAQLDGASSVANFDDYQHGVTW